MSPGTEWAEQSRDLTLGTMKHCTMKHCTMYGVSATEFAAMAAAQDWRCAICGERVEPLCLDHVHATGKVRGLLCRSCNIGMGHLRDDVRRLRAAIRYLEEFALADG